MKRNLLRLVILIIIFFVLLISLAGCSEKKTEIDDGKFRIVTSFYPIYIITLNVTSGAQNVELLNMVENNTGCIHDYTLSTNDLKKLEKADVLIENGLGLEMFHNKILENYQSIKIIDSSENASELIEGVGGNNPHIWTSITNYISQVQKIAESLSEQNPENSEIYTKNANEYIRKLNTLKSNYKRIASKNGGKYVLCLDESFAYLAKKELGLEIVLVSTDHEKESLSAENLGTVIKEVNNRNIKAILVNKREENKLAETIANETGASIYRLDSGLTGSMDKESYISAMQGNLEVLEQVDF